MADFHGDFDCLLGCMTSMDKLVRKAGMKPADKWSNEGNLHCRPGAEDPQRI